MTYRDDGSPFAASFIHLPRKTNEPRAKCRRVEPGMILDIRMSGSRARDRLMKEYMNKKKLGVKGRREEADFESIRRL